MREILFRGKRTDTGEWIEGFYYVKRFRNAGSDRFLAEKPTITTGIEEASGAYGEHVFNIEYAVIPETVGQYTGLTDKHGKRIFEGDICRIKDISYIDDTPFVVEWNNEYSGWFWRDISSATDALIPDIANMAKVIGNIHDNPELLKGGEGDG